MIESHAVSEPPHETFRAFFASLRESRCRVSPQIFLVSLPFRSSLAILSQSPYQQPPMFSMIREAAEAAGCAVFFLHVTSEEFVRFIVVEQEGHREALALFAERGPYVERSLALWHEGAGWSVLAGRRRVFPPATVLAVRQALRRYDFGDSRAAGAAQEDSVPPG